MKSIRSWLAAGFLVFILLAPAAGSPSLLVQVETFFSRLGTPVTAQERAELDFLNCLEEAGKVIPDRSDTQILSAGDSYLHQRSQDILYPRLRLVASNPEYVFSFEGAKEGGTVISEANCGGLQVAVIAHD